MSQGFQDFVLQVKEQADIAKIISRYVPLKRSGSRFVGVCPFHNDHSPSMHVTPQMGIYKCFVCGAGGDVLHFLQEYEKLNFMDSLKMVAEETGLKVPENMGSSQGNQYKNESEGILSAHLLATDFFEKELKKSPEIQKYLELRGVNSEMQKMFNIGFAPTQWDGFLNYSRGKLTEEVLVKAGLIKKNSAGKYRDTFVNRLIFPIWNMSQRVVAFGGRIMDPQGNPKYLNSPESVLYQKSRILYGFNFARKWLNQNTPLILVEGYMDVLALRQQGFENVAAVSGTALTEAHAKIITRFTKKVYLFLDGDKAGQTAIKRSLPVLLKEGIEVLIPEIPNEEDPDSFAKKYGAEGLENVFKNSQNIIGFLTNGYTLNKTQVSPEEKQQIFVNSQSILSHISSEMVKQDYLEMLKKTLGIASQPPISAEPFGYENNAFQSNGIPEQSQLTLNAQAIRIKVMKNPEWQLFRLLLSNGSLCPLAVEKLRMEWLKDAYLRDLMDRLLGFCDEEGRLNLIKLYEQFPEPQKTVLDMIELSDPLDSEIAVQQFDEYLLSLEKRDLLEQLKALNFKIRNREVERIVGLKKQIPIRQRLLEINNDKLIAQEKGKGQ